MMQSPAAALKLECASIIAYWQGPENRMGGIFISYRRDDTAADAGRLRDDLQRRCPLSHVFLDVAIHAGADFREALAAELDTCQVLIELIGPRWLQARNDTTGRRRLDEEVDYVRIEIEAALAKHKLVIPMLLPGTSMPKPDDLPPSIRELAWRNAFALRYDRWGADIDYLISQLPPELGCASETAAAPPPKSIGYVVMGCVALLAALHLFIVFNVPIDPNYVAAGASFALGLAAASQFRLANGQRFAMALAVAILTGVIASILVALLAGENIMPENLTELRLFALFVAIIFVSYLIGMYAADLLRGLRRGRVSNRGGD